MKLLWLLIGFMLCSYIANANNIVAYEYWFNDNHQNRTYVQLNEPILSFSLSLEIDTPILNNALNTIYIRVLDSIGNWSAVSSWQFLKHFPQKPTPSGSDITDNGITKYEYWFNYDRSTKQTALLSGDLNHTDSLSIAVNALRDGINTLHFRYEDSSGYRSAISSWQFIKPASQILTPSGSDITDNGITKYEYWFNYDRSTKQTALLSGDLNHTDSLNIDVDTLNDGINTLHFRYEDSSGYRSAISSWQFIKPASQILTPSGSDIADNGITKYEYWFNYDRSTKQTALLSGDLNHTDSMNINVNGLRNGINTLHFRYEDSSGYRSAISSWQFLKPLPIIEPPSGIDLADNKMTKFEYWFNGDYAKKSESYFNPTASLDLNQDIILPKLPIGENNMFIRFKDSAGYYTVLQSELLVIDGDTLQIFLLSGWNLISSYIEPDYTSIPVVWKDLKDNVVIVKNNAGATYIPAFDIDDIKTWKISEGYQVYTSKVDTLIVIGKQVVPQNSPINLNAGWNIISYLRDSELDCETAFASITDNGNLIIVKDNYGNTYIPAYEINSIGNLLTGQGYQIYVLNPDELIYPGN